MPGLDKQLIKIPLGDGLDQKTDPKLLLPGKLTTAQNLQYKKIGKLEPRNTWQNLAQSPARIDKLFAFGDQIAAISAASPGAIPYLSIVDSQNTLRARCQWPTVPRAELLVRDVAGSGVNALGVTVPKGGPLNSPQFCDSAVNTSGKYTCIIGLAPNTTYGSDGHDVTITAIDNATGQVTYLTNQSGANATRARVLPNPHDDTFVLVTISTNDGAIIIYSIDIEANPETITSKTSLAVIGTGPLDLMDAVVSTVSGVPTLFIAQARTTSNVKITSINTSTWATIATRTQAVLTSAVALCLATPLPNTSTIWLFVCDTSNLGWWFETFNASTLAIAISQTQGPATNQSGPRYPGQPISITAVENYQHGVYVASQHNQDTNVFSDTSNNNSFYCIIYVSIPSNGDTTSAHTSVLNIQRSLALASKLCMVDTNRAMLWTQFVYPGSTQQQFFLMDWGNPQIARAMLSGNSALLFQCAAAHTYLGELPSLHQVSSGVYDSAAVISANRPDVSSNLTRQAVLRFSLNQYDGWKIVERDGRTAVVSGGYLAQFDGRIAAEIGLLMYPDGITLTEDTGGSKTGGGTYSVLAVYVRIDAAGNIHRSVVGSPVSITIGAMKNAIDVKVPSCHVSAEAPRVLIQLYCTKNGGTTYYLEQTIANNVQDQGGNIGTDTPPQISQFCTAQLTMSDTNLGANPQVYDGDGTIDDFQLDAPTTVVISPTRYLAVSGSDLADMQPSKPLKPGLAGGFYDDVKEPIHTGEEEILGLAYLAGRIFAFKDREIFVTSGDGPDDTGNNDTIGVFEIFSQEVGLQDRASLVTTTYGIVFRSHRGFYLLGRDAGLTYIGADVEDAITGNAIIDAAYNKDTREMKFLLSGGVAVLTLTLFESKNGIEWKWGTDSYKTTVDSLHSETWSIQTTGLSDTYPTDLEFLNGNFIAVDGSKLSHSVDGVNWTTVSLGLSAASIYMSKVMWSGSIYVLATWDNSSTVKLFTSPDLATWTQRTTPAGFTGSGGIHGAYGAGKFVVVDAAGDLVYSSDGISWTKISVASGISDIVFGGNAFIAMTGGHLYKSTDGVSWTTGPTPPGGAVVFGPRSVVVNGLVFSMAINGYVEIWNGSSFSSVDTGIGTIPNSIAYGNGTYVVVGFSGAIASSPDASTWTQKTSGTSKNINRIVFQDTYFVAVGGDSGAGAGQGLLSTDGGVTWTLITTSIGTGPALLSAGNSLYVCATTGTVFAIATFCIAPGAIFTAISAVDGVFVGARSVNGALPEVCSLTGRPHDGDAFGATGVFGATYETGWMPIAGVQGFARWYKMFVLGDVLDGYGGSEIVYVDIAYDNVDSYTETRRITLADAIFDGTHFQLEIRTARHKAQSMKIRIRSGATVNGCSFSISGLAILAGMRLVPEMAAQKRL